MTTERIRRTVTATIQAIALKKGGKGEYATVTTAPRPSMKYPDNYNAWDVKTVEGFQSGDTVVLTLEQGKPRRDNPQKPEDYYWDLVGIAPAPEAVPEAVMPPKLAPVVLKGQPANPVPSGSSVDPTRRSIERQVALKAAVELAGYNIAHGEKYTAAQITTVAQHFYLWLVG